MSVTEKPTSRTRSAAKPAVKDAAEAEALRAKTAATRAAADIANQIKAAEAAVKIAASQTQAEEIRQDAEHKRREAAEQQAAAQAAKEKAQRSAEQWKRAAKAIAITCVLVSLPLQMSAFWNPKAPFLVIAPLVLESVAWALLKGAEAAIDDGRPSWHYRVGALLQAVVAAGISFAHGSAAYGLATGLGGALCSLIGPAIWDLHEHGRILKRDGKPTRAQRRAAAKKAAADAAAKQAAKAQEEERRAAVEQLRSVQWPQVWERAVALAAAVGELHPSEPTWKRAWDDVNGAPLGDTAESIAAKVAAKAAAKDAAKDQVTGASTAAKPQVVSQLPPTSAQAVKGTRKSSPAGPVVRGLRYRGDAPRYSDAARRAMSLAARNRREQALAG